MSLQKLSTKNGAWLFRWRSYLPLALFPIIVPAFYDFSYPFNSDAADFVWEMFAFSISLTGLLIRVYTVGFVPEGTSVRETRSQRADALNTTGMYSMTRNPLYLGNFFMMLGITLFFREWWCSLIYVLAFWLYYERIIMAEEAFLKSAFGERFEAYLEQTPAFFPKFGLWQPPALPFSLRTAVRREYSGFFAIIAAFTLLEFVGDYIVAGTVVFDRIWAMIFVFGLVVYLTLRTLKKKTKLLQVEGR